VPEGGNEGFAWGSELHGFFRPRFKTVSNSFFLGDQMYQGC